VFVQVALTPNISSNIQQILELDTADTELHHQTDRTTAIFYSISSTQDGLRGVDLGNHLIKNVVGLLQKENSSLRVFSTLSPIPGLSGWIRKQAERDRPLVSAAAIAPLKGLMDGTSVNGIMLEAIDNPEKWNTVSTLSAAMKPILLQLAAEYLVEAKRNGRILDSVGNFHVRNGACVWRLNWLADTSVNGMKQSAGIMVNYRYILEDLEANTGQYLQKGFVATSERVTSLLPPV